MNFDCVVYGCSHYCNECLPDGVDINSDEVFPVFSTTELDYYPVCEECGEQHTYMTLTTEGRRNEGFWDIEIDGKSYRVEDVTTEGDLTVIETEDGYDFIVFESLEDAEDIIEEHYKELAVNDPQEFAALIGVDRLVFYALGNADIQEVFNEFRNQASNGYFGNECTVTEDTAGEDLRDELGFDPGIAFKR